MSALLKDLSPEMKRILSESGVELYLGSHGRDTWTTPLKSVHLADVIAQVVMACAQVARQHSLKTTGLGEDYAGSVAVEQAILGHFDLD
jgi:hypothetical protein